MKKLNFRLIKLIYKKFSTKVFIAFSVLIFFISFSFTIFYVRHQYNSLTNNLINNGKLLAGILANNSRIGVFSENEDLLTDSINSIYKQQKVLAASIFNSKGVLLSNREKTENEFAKKPFATREDFKQTISEKIKSATTPFYNENTNSFEFWSPVISGSGYASEESLFYIKESAQKNDRVIGFVRVILDKELLNRQRNDLLIKGILMGFIFMMFGSGVAYFVTAKFTKPLSSLTKSVKALESGNQAEKVSVETEDEIGNLAQSFNKMLDSLKVREDELMKSEERLRFLSSRLIQAQEQERRRVSKGLHDEMGQSLALLKHRIRSIEKGLLDEQKSLKNECEETGLYINQIIEDVRRLSRDLSPTILEDIGLSATLEWMLENFEKQHSVQVSIELENIDHLFSQETQINLYRIFQEALTNIAKHAQANHISFAVKKEKDMVYFILEDNGKGIDVNGSIAKNITEKGMGLTTMDERARMIGAVLDITSSSTDGTRITLEIPV